ncbi:hypothetical protein BHM03_00059802 [Ensete ventricosum]|nr:hypothetical protein BHM03_00059802 [Ensete ventricosum]
MGASGDGHGRRRIGEPQARARATTVRGRGHALGFLLFFFFFSSSSSLFLPQSTFSLNRPPTVDIDYRRSIFGGTAQ